MSILKRAQNLLDRKINQVEHDETALQQSNIWISSITWGLIATVGLSIGWLAIAKTEEIVVAQGTLKPIGSVKDIQMPIGGITDKILVKDGDKVNKGQILMKLDTEASSQSLRSLEFKLESKKHQLLLKQTEMDRYLRQNKNSINTITKRITYEKEVSETFQSLVEQGASAELQYMQQQNKLMEAIASLKETKLEGEKNIAILEQNIQILKSEIADIQTKKTEAEVTLRYQELRSPVDGVIFDLQAKGPGYTAPTTEVVMRVVPFNALEAKIEIPSSSIGFVKIGMNADISIDSYPSSDFGVVEGVVDQISSDALAPDASEQKSNYRYPATIKLTSQKLKLKNGDILSLQPGMSLNANIKLRKVSYLQMLLGGFQDKADSLRQVGRQ